MSAGWGAKSFFFRHKKTVREFDYDIDRYVMFYP